MGGVFECGYCILFASVFGGCGSRLVFVGLGFVLLWDCLVYLIVVCLLAVCRYCWLVG